MITIKKSNINEHNGAGRRGGCYDTGTSVVWQILQDGDEDIPHMGVSRKRDAQLIADIINEHFPCWDGSIGCVYGKALSVANAEQLIKLYDVKEI